MRSVAPALALVLFVGCGNDKEHAHPRLDGMMTPDAPLYYQPPDSLKNWDIQLRGPLDLTVPRDLMILDLFDVVPSQQAMGDVTVPAGAHPTAIADAQAMGAKVMCTVGVGAIRLSDPDASKFAGFEAAPPDRPDAPDVGSVIGWTSGGDVDERYLDLNQSSTWLPRIEARIAFAKTIGCDGIMAWRMNYAGADTGWPVDGAAALAAQGALFARVATVGHAARITVGLQTVSAFGLDDLESTYDFVLVERCGELADCDQYRDFKDSARPVLSLEYQSNLDGDPNTLAGVCADQTQDGLSNGLLKDDALTGAVRMQCL